MTTTTPRYSAVGAWCMGALLIVLGVAVLAQTAQKGPAPQQPALQIVSPVEGSLISGRVVLRADLDPPAAASSVVFFLDGRQVCTVTAPPFECLRDVGAAVIAHQVRVVANIPGGTRVVRTVRTKELGYTEKVDVDVVQVTATVLDSRGRYVKGLKRDEFHVFEDDRAQALTHFAAEDVPLELIVAVDISGSMAPAMPKLKSAVKTFLDAVPAEDQVTLLGFNDTVFALARATTQRADRDKAVDRLAAWGGTALYDVILRAVDMAGRQVGRKAIVVFTDGEDEGSHAVIGDVEQRLQASDATLYMIGQGRGVTLDPLKRVMERLSRPTGGQALFTESIDELHEAFDKLLDELSHQYLLGYPPTRDVHDEAFRRIKVTVDGPYQVRARQGYRASAVK